MDYMRAPDGAYKHKQREHVENIGVVLAKNPPKAKLE